MKTSTIPAITRSSLIATASYNARWFAGLLAGSAVLGSAAMAADNIWIGAANNANWNDPGNWSFGRVPVQPSGVGDGFDDAIVNQNVNFPVIVADLAAVPRDIVVGSGTGSGRVDHHSGIAASGNGNWSFIGREGGTGVYNLADTTSAGDGLTGFAQGGGSFSSGGRFYVGGNQNSGGGNGVLNMNTTGALTTGSDLAIGSSGGRGIMNLDSGTVTTTAWTFIGKREAQDGGYGTLNIAGGSITHNGERNYVGLGNSRGEMIMSGGSYTSLASNNNSFFAVGVNNLANATTSTLDMTGGTLTAARRLSIGGMANDNGNTDANFAGPGKGAMTLNGAGAVVNALGEFWLGQGSGSTGTLDFSAGTINSGSWIAIGRGSGTGTVNMTGGTWNKTGAGSQFIVGSSGPGTMTMTGGKVDVQGGYTWVGEGPGGAPAVLTISDAAEFISPLISVGPESPDATLNLDGGIVRTRRFMGTRDENGGNLSGTGTINFNGAQIIASADNTAFISTTVDHAVIGAGGLLVDSNGFSLIAPKALTGTGGVVKSGEGTLALLGISSYTGDHVVEGGMLILGNESEVTSDITVEDGAGLGVTVTSWPDEQVSPENVTFGQNTTFLVSYGDVGFLDDAPLNVTGTLTLNGDVTVNMANDFPQVGSIPVLAYDNKTGPGQFVLGTLPLGVTATLVDDNNGLVSLNITSAALPVWKGEVGDTPNGNWDTTTQNWQNFVTSLPIAYSDGNPALFDDAAFGATDIVLNGTVAPGSVTFDNSDNHYTLSGSGKITGEIELLKKGTASLGLATANDYTGATRLEGGVTSIPSIANGGAASPIGASPAAPENLVLAGGLLEYTGGSPATTDRGFTVAGGDSGIIAGQNLTFGGPVATTAGSFVKSGAGALRFTHDGPNVFGGNAGETPGLTINEGAFVLDGSGGDQAATTGGALFLANAAGLEASLTLVDTELSVAGIFQSARQPDSKASLTVDNARLNVDRFQLSLNGTAETVAVIDNAGSINKTGGSWISIGNDGKGTMTVKNGGSFSSTGGDFNISDVGTSQGFLNIESGGTVSSGGATYIGKNGLTLPSELNITGAGSSFTGNTTIFVGWRGNATVNLSNGGTLNAGGWVTIGRQRADEAAENPANRPAGTGVINVNTGGVLNQTGTEGVIVAEGGTGTLNVRAGGSVSIAGGGLYLTAEANTPGQAVVNLDGGSITTRRVIEREDAWSSTANSSIFNFNGGTLRAGANAFADFMSGLDAANILAGGAVIDTNGQDISIAQRLLGAGALTKQGGGTLTLSGANTYGGNTTVSAGTLSMASPAFADTAAVTVANGATLHLTHDQDDLVAGLTIHGTTYTDTTLVAGSVPGLTGSGSITVGTPTGTAYDTWATANGLSGAEAAWNVDGPDQDGILNILEYILGGDPLASDLGTGILPDAEVIGNDFVFTFHRSDLSETDTTLIFQWGSDLTGWTNVPIGPVDSTTGNVTVGVAEIGDSPDAITVRVPVSNAQGGKLFGRLNATKP